MLVSIDPEYVQAIGEAGKASHGQRGGELPLSVVVENHERRARHLPADGDVRVAVAIQVPDSDGSSLGADREKPAPPTESLPSHR